MARVTEWALPLLVATLAGCTTAEQRAENSARSERELALTLEDRVPGPAQRCLNPANFSGSQPVGDSILFRRTGRTIYRSQVADSCPFLRPEGDQIVVNEIYGGQICAGDRFRLLDRNTRIPSAFCRYSEFVPYERPKR